MEIAVGHLKVIMYVPIQCSKHTWNLTIKPIQECPYYRCIINNDASLYDGYIALWAKRDPVVMTKHPYVQFISLLNNIKTKGYTADEKEDAISVYHDTTCLEDGHHRAAIICALYGPEHRLNVDVLDDELPCDIDQCANPCRS